MEGKGREVTGGEGSKGKVERGGEETGEKGREGDGKEGKGREGEVGCGARRPAGARSPALAKDGPETDMLKIISAFADLASKR